MFFLCGWKALVFFLGLLQLGAVLAAPVIRPGREAEVEALFSGLAQRLPGWSLPSIQIDRDRIRAFLVGPDARFTVELQAAGSGRPTLFKSKSFEISVLESQGLDPSRQKQALDQLVALLAENEKDWRWDRETGLAAELGRGEKTIAGAAFIFCWLALAFGVGCALWLFFRSRPWRENPDRLALLLVCLAAAGGFLVRWLVVGPGPGQLVSRVPTGPGLPGHLPEFGPAHSAWVLIWYWLAGTDDRSAFLSGAVMGVLAVVAAGALAWLLSGRAAGAAASWLLALWPAHARLSPTDDAWVMIATLLCAACAFLSAAAKLESRLALLAAWLAALLAALTRPEPLLALAPLLVWVLSNRGLRHLQLRPLGLAALALLFLLALPVSFLSLRWAAGGSFDALACAFGPDGWKLFDFFRGGSLLAPPRTPLFLTLLFAAALAFCLWKRRWILLWPLALTLAPALPLACMFGSDWVTARYQLSLLPAASVMCAALVAWSPERIAAWRKIAMAGVWLTLLGGFFAAYWSRPWPEPTFRLEYSFFRRQLPHVPAGCSLVLIEWPQTDLGLRVPEHLTPLLKLGQRWIKPSAELDARNQCIVYWQPASCRARNPDWQSASGLHPDCELIERGYRLDPLFTARLPARSGFCETYLEDPVPVGFYRLRPR